MEYDLNHNDIHGRAVRVGDRVRTSADSDRSYEVLLVEGPIPGSRSTADGWGTLLLNGHERGNEVGSGNFVVQARFVEVI